MDYLLKDLIFDEKLIVSIGPGELDEMLEKGWRHFGTNFFRYNISLYNERVCTVLPLRVVLDKFNFSKTQKKILRRNQHFLVKIGPARITEDKISLFEAHKQKFTDNVPESIFSFVSKTPATVPTNGLEVCVYDGSQLIAASFMDESKKACSSIYGMFDLNYSKHSLGLYTMLIEISYAISKKKLFYYHGYSYSIPSFYDYKKKFNQLQCYNWKGEWLWMG